MVNLIPPRAKKSLVIEYWFRVMTVWSFLFGIVAILIILTTLPVYVLISARIDVYQETAAVAEQKLAAFTSVSEELTRSSQQAQIILSGRNDVSVSEIIQLFERLETDGITYSRVNITKEGEGVAPVLLSGQATTRQDLADFRDRLRAESLIKMVDFPISNLTKERNINFSMTVTMTNEPIS